MWQHFRELDKTNERIFKKHSKHQHKKIDKKYCNSTSGLAGKIDKGNIATALQELVAKIPELTKIELAELAAKNWHVKHELFKLSSTRFLPSAQNRKPGNMEVEHL